MSTFLSWAKKFGVDQITERRAKLQKCATTWTHQEILWYICGYDYITAPSDRKFEGIRDVFLSPNAPLCDTMNWTNRVNDPVTVARMLQAYRPGSSTNISVMAKTLDYCASHIQTNSSLNTSVNGSYAPKTGAEFTKFCTPLSEALAPYWGNQLARIGLMPMTSPGLGSRFKKKLEEMKQSFQLMSVDNVQTRGRSRGVGF